MNQSPKYVPTAFTTIFFRSEMLTTQYMNTQFDCGTTTVVPTHELIIY